MKVSRKWIDWAHGPGAEDGQPLAMALCDLANSPGTSAICITDPALIVELVDVAELYRNPCAGDVFYDMGPWWMGQPRRIISEGRAALQLWVASRPLAPGSGEPLGASEPPA
jgi:hypothetical protein